MIDKKMENKEIDGKKRNRLTIEITTTILKKNKCTKVTREMHIL